MRDPLFDVAYLAGIIDADGFISAHRTTHKGKIYIAPLIGISGTSPEPHQLAKRVWGGSLFTYTPKNPTHKLQYMWQAVGIRAGVAVGAIRPFLRMKQSQAEIAIEMWNLIDRGMHRTNPQLVRMADRISKLNLRNPPRKPEALR